MRVLLADDEKMEREGLRYLFRRHGICAEFAEASTGREALRLLKEEEFDLVITDIKMPEMDGLHFLSEACRAGGKRRYIIYSGYSDFEYAKKAIRLGVIDYLVKPVEEEEFSLLLHRIEKEIREEKEEARREATRRALSEGEKQALRRSRSSAVSPPGEGSASVGEKAAGSSGGEVGAENTGKETRAESAPEPHHAACPEKRVLAFTLGRAVLEERAEDFREEILKELGEAELFIANEQEGHLLLPSLPQEYLLLALRRLCENLEKQDFPYIHFFLLPPYRSLDELSERAALGRRFINRHFFAARSMILDRFPEHALQAEESFAEIELALRRGELTEEEALDLMSDVLREKVPFSTLYTKYTILKHLERLGILPSAERVEAILKAADGSELARLICEARQDRPLRKREDESAVAAPAFPLPRKDAVTNEELLIRKAKAYMETHYASAPGLEEIAAAVHLNPSYFCQLFKKRTGETVITFLTKLRLSEAARLLRNSEQKLSEISAALGYSNPSYFSLIFKNKYGLSPGAYRQVYAETEETSASEQEVEQKNKGEDRT